jgi:hypothetical protein
MISAADLQWANDVFTSLTGYSVKTGEALASDDVVDWDTKSLLVRMCLPTDEHLLAIIGAFKRIFGVPTLSSESTAPDTAPDTALSRNSDEVISLDEQRRLHRQRGST